ncbi:hypothetical protein SPHINGOT1_510006 [Sphingomonas sp. T1]|jgi:hypothetical protein|nr:hypothetical protein [Sphingomonas sp. T1]VXD04878.1 hypothetical protein SPHINGOT1_510006 [Sphingomonas sp. T1]
MAMIDFEDRAPARPLSWGEKLLATIVTVLSVYGIAATAWSLLT